MTMARQIPPLTVKHLAADESIPIYDARDLVRDGTQARIVLDDQCYWLRVTRAGKLILTK